MTENQDWVFDDDVDDGYDPFDAEPVGFHSNSNNGRIQPARRSVSTGVLPSVRAEVNSREFLNNLSPHERQALPRELNAMQTQILPLVLGSDTSIVLSAPTGAGKTCVLDMAILRSLMFDGGRTRIYYVAPSRALCRLQSIGFSQRFRNFNMRVEVITGDESPDDEGGEELVRGRQPSSVTMTSMMWGGPSDPGSGSKSIVKMIVCTPEKLEAETRKCSDTKLASTKVLLLVDEVHHVGERERGATLELVLTRFLWAFRANRQDIRFVSVSATIPNGLQVASWLGNATYSEFRQRPVPLHVHVLGYPKSSTRSDFLFEQDLDRYVPEVLRTYGTGKPALIFVSSRKAAKDLASKLREAGVGSRSADLSTVKTSDDTLTECLRNGLGFHSAGLATSDRAIVENLFKAGKLKVVCCTSTLAVGVDLPANLVIIKSTRAYRGPVQGFQDIERATLVQMIGRAGRPGYDIEGIAVIMTSSGEESKFHDLSNGLVAVSSQLSANNLREGLNAEIVKGRLLKRTDCMSWWSMTFASTASSWDETHLEALQTLGCATVQDFDDGSSSIAPTSLGRIASTHHLRLATVAKFNVICAPSASEPMDTLDNKDKQGKDDKWGLEDVARVVCDEEEFKELVPRRDQKKFLNSVSWTLGRFKSPKSVRVSTQTDVAFQLLQARLGGLTITDHSLRVNTSFVLDSAPRLARALLKMLVDSKSSKAVVCALLCKCLEAKCWETDEVSQLDGIGLKTREKLITAGVNTLRDVVMPSNNSIVPVKALAHARVILASRREPRVSLVDGALIITLNSPASSSSAGPQQTKPSKVRSSEWWLACIGGPDSQVLGWSELLDRLVVPVADVRSATVLAVHRKYFGIDSQLTIDIHVNGQIQVDGPVADFWEGFHDSPTSKPQTTPITQPTGRKSAKAGNAGTRKKPKDGSQPIDAYFVSTSSDGTQPNPALVRTNYSSFQTSSSTTVQRTAAENSREHPRVAVSLNSLDVEEREDGESHHERQRPQNLSDNLFLRYRYQGGSEEKWDAESSHPPLQYSTVPKITTFNQSRAGPSGHQEKLRESAAAISRRVRQHEPTLAASNPVSWIEHPQSTWNPQHPVASQFSSTMASQGGVETRSVNTHPTFRPPQKKGASFEDVFF